MNIYFKLLLILFLSILFLNCYEQTITINENNKGGIIDYNISIYKDFEAFVSNINKNQKSNDKLSILLNRNSLNNLSEKNNGSRIMKYELNKNDYSSMCNLSIIFDDLNNIPKELPTNYFPFRISEKKNSVTVITVINMRDYINRINITLKPEEQKIIETYSGIIKIKLIFNAPKRITSKNFGELSNNDRQLIYETTLNNILFPKNNENKIEIEFTYLK